MTDVHERVFVRDVVVLLNLTKKVYVRLSPAIDKIEDSEVTKFPTTSTSWALYS